MIGKFKTFIGDSLTLGHPPGPDSQHKIAPNATVTLDNKASKMGDLKPDDDIDVSGDPATSVTATRTRQPNVTHDPRPDPELFPRR